MIHGNTQGLKASQRKALKKLAGQRIKHDLAVTPEFANRLAKVSSDLNRAIGALVDRRGRVQSVVVGDATRLYLPDIGRQRGGGLRFRGIRLVRSNLGGGSGLSNDDLTDLSKLQLDMVLSIDVDGTRPGAVTWAHLIPDNPERELWRVHNSAHPNAIEFEFTPFIQELEAEFERKRDATVEMTGDRAMLVYVRTREDYAYEANIEELHELCRTAGVEIVDTYVQSRVGLDPKFATGSGALEEIELRCLQLGADILIYGQDLSTSQVRHITERTNLRVIDRTQLILDIFAQHAKSRGGKLQVELAQLKYSLPRLTGRGTAMSRLAGGIGGRGPGESKLEIDRRRVRDRINSLEKDIDSLSRNRELRRKNRRVNDVPVVAIVGYTNAGKSTLLNTLTNSEVISENKLFATLDPTSRRLRFPEEREIVLTDTVGFIRDLPRDLQQAFRATLEELDDADLLLHVIDGSDPAFEEHIESTEGILHELGLDETARIRVFNKIDLVEEEALSDLRAAFQDSVFVSARSRQTTMPLIDALDRWLLMVGHAEKVPLAR